MSERDECDDCLRKLSLKHKILGEFDDLSGILLGPNSNSELYQNDQIATQRHVYPIDWN